VLVVLVVVELVDVDEAGTVLVVVVGCTAVSATLAVHAAGKRQEATRTTRVGNRRCTARIVRRSDDRSVDLDAAARYPGRRTCRAARDNPCPISRIYNPAIFNRRSWEIQ